MDIRLGLDDLKLAVALFNLTGALDPRNGAVIEQVTYQTFNPDDAQVLEGGEVYLRVEIRIAQSDDPIVAFVPRSVVALAAGRLPVDVLFGVQLGTTIASTSVVGDTLPELTIRADLPPDLIDRIAASTPPAPAT